MQAKSSTWWSALQAHVANWTYGVDLLAADEQTSLENTSIYDQFASDRLMPGQSEIDLDTSAKTHRKFTLHLRNSDGRYLPGPSGFASGGQGSPTATGLTWLNVRFRPWIALATGYSVSASGAVSLTYDRTYLGIYVLTQPEMQVLAYGGIAILSLLDKSTLLCKPNLISSNTYIPTYTATGGKSAAGYPAGYSLTAAIDDLISHAYANLGISGAAARVSIEPNGLTLPNDYPITEGDDFWTHIQAIAASCGFVAYYDSLGAFVCKQNPLTINAPSAYTFKPGPRSIISKVDRQTDFSNTFNHFAVLGGSSKHGLVRGEASVQDPSNPYHRDRIGDRLCFVGSGGKLGDLTPDPNVASIAQAQVLAQTYLAAHLGEQEQVQVAGRNIPALEPYDRCTLIVPGAGLAMDFLLTSCTWRLGHDQGGGMQATFNRWYSAQWSFAGVILADDPLRYYRMDDGTATCLDWSASQQPGAYAGGYTQDAPGLLVGDPDAACTFDGSSGYVSLPTTGLPTGTHAWTMEALISYTTIPASGGTVCWFGTDTSDACAILSLASNGAISGGTNGSGVGAPTALTPGAAHHVALTYDGSTMMVYADGAQVGTLAVALNIVAGTAEIGRMGASDYFGGTIDEVAIYSEALSAAQIASHYRAAKGGIAN